MRDEAKAFDIWLRADLARRFDTPKDLPSELEQLIDKACRRD